MRTKINVYSLPITAFSIPIIRVVTQLDQGTKPTNPKIHTNSELTTSDADGLLNAKNTVYLKSLHCSVTALPEHISPLSIGSYFNGRKGTLSSSPHANNETLQIK